MTDFINLQWYRKGGDTCQAECNCTAGFKIEDLLMNWRTEER